jgi:hypothetical protein
MAAAKKKPVKKAKAAPKRERKPQEAKHEPTAQNRAIVERASLTGKLTHEDIAALIGISDVTLRKYYAAELRSGRDKTTVAVLNSFVKNCVGDEKRPGDVNAQKFYLERFAGMTPKTEIEHSGSVEVTGPDLAGLTDEQLDALDALAETMDRKPARAN